MLAGQYEFNKKPLGLHLTHYLEGVYDKNKDNSSVLKVRRSIAQVMEKTGLSQKASPPQNEPKKQ